MPWNLAIVLFLLAQASSFKLCAPSTGFRIML